MNEFDLFDFMYNPYGPNGLEEQEPKVLNWKYILEYCNEYSLESDPDTIYHEWIQLYEGNDSIILEMIMEEYMRIIERSTGKVITKHPKQRKVINIEKGVKTNGHI